MKYYKLEYDFDFLVDFEEVLSWYDNISASVSECLRVEIKTYILKIQTSPKSFKKLSSNEIRRVVLKKFPYKILYQIEEDIVKILALIHTSRSNKFISKKLK